MNICLLNGFLVRPPVVFAEGKAIKFVMATNYRIPGRANQTRVAYVPCVIFEASKELELDLKDSGNTTEWEMQGRIMRTSYEAGGEKKYVTEVTINPWTIHKRKKG